MSITIKGLKDNLIKIHSKIEKHSSDIEDNFSSTSLAINNEKLEREQADNSLQMSINDARAIAEGRSKAKVFATEIAMNTWLASPTNTSTLNIGDNFWIVQRDVPDYWWDGTQPQILETEKVDLSDYFTRIEIENLLSGKVSVIDFNNHVNNNTAHITASERSTWNTKASTATATQAVNGLMSSTDKTKLDGVATGANNYTHPANHPASIITQDSNNRFVSDTEKTAWDNKLDNAAQAADSAKLGGKAASEFATATQGAKADSAYQKPAGGIVKSDLANTVQTSLGKADTALQTFTETDPTVPAWAKAANKPTYTANDVGLGNVPNLDTTNAVNNQHMHSNKAVLDATTASFTTTLKIKLDNIESGDQNSYICNGINDNEIISQMSKDFFNSPITDECPDTAVKRIYVKGKVGESGFVYGDLVTASAWDLGVIAYAGNRQFILDLENAYLEDVNLIWTDYDPSEDSQSKSAGERTRTRFKVNSPHITIENCSRNYMNLENTLKSVYGYGYEGPGIFKNCNAEIIVNCPNTLSKITSFYSIAMGFRAYSECINCTAAVHAESLGANQTYAYGFYTGTYTISSLAQRCKATATFSSKYANDGEDTNSTHYSCGFYGSSYNQWKCAFIDCECLDAVTGFRIGNQVILERCKATVKPSQCKNSHGYTSTAGEQMFFAESEFACVYVIGSKSVIKDCSFIVDQAGFDFFTTSTWFENLAYSLPTSRGRGVYDHFSNNAYVAIVDTIIEGKGLVRSGIEISSGSVRGCNILGSFAQGINLFNFYSGIGGSFAIGGYATTSDCNVKLKRITGATKTSPSNVIGIQAGSHFCNVEKCYVCVEAEETLDRIYINVPETTKATSTLPPILATINSNVFYHYDNQIKNAESLVGIQITRGSTICKWNVIPSSFGTPISGTPTAQRIIEENYIG